MERQDLKKANDILYRIERREKQLEQLSNTKEFCSINIKGENGNGKEFNFKFDNDKEIISLIRNNISDFLKTDIEKGIQELKEL